MIIYKGTKKKNSEEIIEIWNVLCEDKKNMVIIAYEQNILLWFILSIMDSLSAF